MVPLFTRRNELLLDENFGSDEWSPTRGLLFRNNGERVTDNGIEPAEQIFRGSRRGFGGVARISRTLYCRDSRISLACTNRERSCASGQIWDRTRTHWPK